MLLIPEKVAVPSQPPRISRPRLLAMLESSLESCASTVVSGRAGTGKTALAIDFARTCARPVAWYKVDAADIELAVFLSYLVSSIAQQRPGFGAQTLAALTHPCADYVASAADSFVYELLEYDGSALLIVLEDLHLVCEGDWLVPFLCRLLPLLPRKVHILITSRTLPPAPLWRMRSKQTLEVIDEAMLAFTRPEAFELFQTYGLSGELARAAFDRSRGRASSLATDAIALSTSEKVEANHCGESEMRQSRPRPWLGAELYATLRPVNHTPFEAHLDDAEGTSAEADKAAGNNCN
jgi:LuxR family maltose regulon positive regulatory protein